MLQGIAGHKVRLNPAVMLLFAFGNGCKCVKSYGEYVDCGMFINSTKMESAIPTVGEWLVKVRYLCLLNKLASMCRYRMGFVNALEKFGLQRECFLVSRYAKYSIANVKEYILTVL